MSPSLARLAFAALALSACYNVPDPACGFSCGENGACPTGYTCFAIDGTCHANRGSPDHCGPIPPDAEMPPAPMVTTTSPFNNDMVFLPVTVLVRFNVPVAPPPIGSIALTRVNGEIPIGIDVMFDPDMQGVGFTIATLTPTERYRVDVTAQIHGLDGQPLRPSTFTFLVVEDTEPPHITTVSPPSNATNVSVQPAGVVMFSEQVRNVTAQTYRMSRGGVDVPLAITFVDGQTTAQSAPLVQLEPSTSYDMLVTQGVTDLSSNPLVADIGWSFTTGADLVPPHVLAVTPVVTLAIPVDQTFTVTFDEPITGASSTSITLSNGVNASAATVTYDAPTRTATVVPTAPLQLETTYTLNLGAPIMDLYGNVMQPYSTKFTTEM